MGEGQKVVGRGARGVGRGRRGRRVGLVGMSGANESVVSLLWLSLSYRLWRGTVAASAIVRRGVQDICSERILLK